MESGQSRSALSCPHNWCTVFALHPSIHPTAYCSPGDQQQSGKRIINLVVPAGRGAMKPSDAAADDKDFTQYGNIDQDPKSILIYFWPGKDY